MTQENVPADAPKPGQERVGLRLGLSGKLLVLTILFVMISEALIYVPSIANFRLSWLNDRLGAATPRPWCLTLRPAALFPRAWRGQFSAASAPAPLPWRLAPSPGF